MIFAPTLRRLAPLLVALAACDGAPVGPVEDDSPTPEVAPTEWDGVEVGPEVVCDEPTSGFDRLVDEAAVRGLDFDQAGVEQNHGLNSGGVVATDLDGDGDVDLLLGRRNDLYNSPRRAFPRAFANDGDAHFVEVPLESRLAGHDPPSAPMAFLAVDLTGDRLPEIVQVGSAWAAYALNEGDLSWGPMLPLYVAGAPPEPRFSTAAFGDLDGDGDLDLVLPAVQTAVEGGPPQGDSGGALPEAHADLVLLQDEHGDFVLSHELEPYGRPAYSQMAIFTDRDADGDQDLYVVSEFGGLTGADPSAFYRNDGLDPDGAVRLINDADEIGADVNVGGMGIDAADLDGDGHLDYCIAQFGPLICLLHDEADSYYDAAPALGLRIPVDAATGDSSHPPWSAYSLDLADLDNDGDLDVVVVAGNPDENDTSGIHLDRLWERGDDGLFTDRSDDLGFAAPERHFGLGTADFDGDGALDLVVAGTEGTPALWMNRCTAGAWLEVDLVGPPGNREAHGAQIRLEAGDLVALREQYNLRSLGQGPARFHFGLGDAPVVDRLEVRWPGGDVTVYEGLPVRRRLVISRED